MKIKLIIVAALVALGISTSAIAEHYVIDKKGQHAVIQFKVSHLGYSWLIGRFNDFEGTFSYDEKNPAAAKVNVTINTASVDSNHAARDKHLRGPDFFNVDKYPTSTFVSQSFKALGNGKAKLNGTFTLNGVSKAITIDVSHVGHGQDPWGGFRRGFEGTTNLNLADWNIPFAPKLGPASANVQLYFSFEGIRQ